MENILLWDELTDAAIGGNIQHADKDRIREIIEQQAQRYLGHADVQTMLKIYTHLSEQKQTQSLQALNAHFDTFDDGL